MGNLQPKLKVKTPPNKDAALLWDNFITKYQDITENHKKNQPLPTEQYKQYIRVIEKVIKMYYDQLVAVDKDHQSSFGLELYYGRWKDSLKKTTPSSSPNLRTSGISKDIVTPTIVVDEVVKLVGQSVAISLGKTLLASPYIINHLRIVDFKLHGEPLRNLIDVLSTNKLISVIDFSGNIFGDEEVSKLIPTLKSLKRMSKVYLNNCRLIDSHVIDLVDNFLTHRKRVYHIEMRSNQIRQVGYIKLYDFTLENTHITGMHIEENPVAENSIDIQNKLQKLQKVLTRNQAVSEVLKILLLAVNSHQSQRKFSLKIQSFRRSMVTRAASSGGTIELPLTKKKTTIGSPGYKVLSRSMVDESFARYQLSNRGPSKRFRYGVVEEKGQRTTMEDVVVANGCFRGREDEDYFAVFDGHGGKDCAEYVAKNLTEKVKEYLDQNIDPSQSLRRSFISVNRDIAGWALYTGTTATVCLIVKDQMIIANAGDTRAVLCRGNKPQLMTIDHNPQNEDEFNRVISLGGDISNGRVQGAISVTRSIGDARFHPYLSAEPNIIIETIQQDDEFMIIASDGLWDCVSPEEAIQLVHLAKDHPLSAAEKLKDETMRKGSQDNISVVVIAFKSLKSPSPSPANDSIVT